MKSSYYSYQSFVIFVFVYVYFLFNSFLLPQGLLYTQFLVPFLLFDLARMNKLKSLNYFFITIFFFLPFHLWFGVDVKYYSISLCMFILNYIFCCWIYFSLITSGLFERGIKTLVYANLFMFPIAFIALYIPWAKETLWYLLPISPGLPVFPRLKLFTYEASYYSLLICPVFLFYMWKMVIYPDKKLWLLFVSLFLSLILSFSAGVIGGLIVAIALTFILKPYFLISFVKKRPVIVAGLAGILVLLIFYVLFSHGVVHQRLVNIYSGKDTSANGRTFQAFYLGWEIVKSKNIVFGAGLGQMKELGRDIIIQYYQYMDIPKVARIPNCMADYLVTFGLLGCALKFIVEFFFFIKTKVKNSFFRLSVFIFIFIYQFTGSYVPNIAEYIMWMIAFSPMLDSYFVLNPAERIDPRQERN